MEITFTEFEGEYFAESMKVSSPKVSITLDAADPTLFHFENVPEESITAVKDTSESDCNFNLTANEIIQIKKFMDFDSNDEVEFKVNGTVQVCSEGAYEIQIDEEYTSNGSENIYKIDKQLFKMVDINSYTVYPIKDEDKVIFESTDGSMEIVVTLHEDVDF